MSMEVAMLKQQITDLEAGALFRSSQTLHLLMDLQVMLEDGDDEEALTLLKQYTEGGT